MKTTWTFVGVAVLAVAVLFGVYMVDIDQTQDARLPDVDVSVEGGQAPEFDAEVGSISVGTDETTVTVPDVEITTTEETVTVPTLNVTPPENDG